MECGEEAAYFVLVKKVRGGAESVHLRVSGGLGGIAVAFLDEEIGYP